MLNLILTILFTSWLLISFRVFALLKIDPLQAIILNYFVCAVTGFFFDHNYEKILALQRVEPWLICAVITGACFLPTFYLMAYSVKHISVTITTIASKTSLIIPVTVSLLYLNSASSFTWMNTIGLVLGFGAIVMTSVKNKEDAPGQDRPVNKFHYFLPALVFLGGGLVDVLVNITNSKFLPEDKSGLFPFFAFSASATTGLIVLTGKMAFAQEKIRWKNLAGGLILGIPNYLSIFFLIRALRDFDNNGALIFPVLNICVILVNSLIAIVFFKEKMTRFNYLGLALALLSLLMLISN